MLFYDSDHNVNVNAFAMGLHDRSLLHLFPPGLCEFLLRALCGSDRSLQAIKRPRPRYTWLPAEGRAMLQHMLRGLGRLSPMCRGMRVFFPQEMLRVVALRKARKWPRALYQSYVLWETPFGLAGPGHRHVQGEAESKVHLSGLPRNIMWLLGL